MIRLRGLGGHIVLISSATTACSGAEDAEEEEALDEEDVARATSLSVGSGVERQLKPGAAAAPPRARGAMR